MQTGLSNEQLPGEQTGTDRNALSSPLLPTRPATTAEEVELTFGQWAYRFFLFRLPVYLLLIFELYVLSIGPLYFKWYDSFAMFDTQEDALAECGAIGLFYLPLLSLCHYWPPFGDLVDWYLHTFWV